MDYSKLTDLLLPDVIMTVEEAQAMYPKRHLPADARVTRIAPSPTGFMHLGGVFAALASERLAHQSGGVFYLRIEDTDRKREVKGSIPEIIESLDYFGIRFDEGEIKPGFESGSYGPYRQSMRGHIYKAFIKDLLRKGMAYPCFCTPDRLDEIRAQQKKARQLTGYYGDWAVCRNISIDEIYQKLLDGTPFIIRLKSPGDPDKRIVYDDLIKGRIELPENIQDIVLLKQDGLPTYHFAHAIDDHLMGTTHVFRGDEWLASVPIHLQLFEMLGWAAPCYGHISPLMKMDGMSKRKFSKRKDPEFAAKWYIQQGYPGEAVVEYLLSILNSNFEEWRQQNLHEPKDSFKVAIEKMSGSGALFDLDKMINFSRNYIAALSADAVFGSLLNWSSQYDRDFYSLLKNNKDYAFKVLGIDRGTDKPRKDFSKWSDVKPVIGYFFDELFGEGPSIEEIADLVNGLDVQEISRDYIDIYDERDDKTVWFEKLKDLCDKLGYARDMKSYKRDPSAYKGHVGDVAMVLRAALTGRTTTPDLYTVMKIIGYERVIRRLSRFL